jgi:hypothetical protein
MSISIVTMMNRIAAARLAGGAAWSTLELKISPSAGGEGYTTV